MSETKNIKVRLADGTIEECSIEILSPPPWKIIFSGLGFEKREFSERDLFESLIALRIELEKTGAQVLCAGARQNVFPSGMSRDMGGGRKAYVAQIGHPMSEEIFDIFDYAGLELVSTVANQKQFFKKWSEALRKRRA